MIIPEFTSEAAHAAAPVPPAQPATHQPAPAPAPHEPAVVHLEAMPAHLIETAVHPPLAIKPPGSLVHIVPQQNLRRIPTTIDPIGSASMGLETALDPFRLAANGKVFGGLKQIQLHTANIQKILDEPSLPATLIGAVHQPDGGAAARVQLQFKPASVGGKGGVTTVLTADNGGFTMNMPVGAKIPSTGLSITVHGANKNVTLTLTADQIAANGMVGVLMLPDNLSPLPVSILAALQALTPVDAPAAAPVKAPPRKKHALTIGEHGSVCSQTFSTSEKTDRFPWGLFFRIVEPQMSIATQTREVSIAGNFKSWMPIYKTALPLAGPVTSKLVDRIPIDQPLSVDGFRDQLAGIDGTGTFTEDEAVPMASSLGLGYILRMAQQWKFDGLGLGDLVYSLPLAPGEQQQVAVFERQDTSAVQESESFSQVEAMNQSAMSDTSTNATFNQAFNEMVAGSSAFSTDSSSASAGLSFGIGPVGFGGGGGSSSSSGNSNSSLQGSRDTTSQASQATHSSAENTAAARLNAQRVGMRLASVSENMGTTTKTITNHNHVHALTMQYWEVLRMYDVSTTIEGVTLVCLIPMQIVRFMPPKQPVALTDPSIVDSSEKVMERYKNVLKHIDVMQRAVPGRFQRGLNLLAQFASDPTTVVDAASATAETVIKLELRGNFVTCEKIMVCAVTKRNTRVGPVQLSPSTAGLPLSIPLDKFMSHDELTSWLNDQRQNTQAVLQASLAVPSSINRSDIIGFEISRQFSTVVYSLTSAARQAAEKVQSDELHESAPSIFSFLGDALKSGGLGPMPAVTLRPAELENLLGGPTLLHFYAAVENFNKTGTDQPAAQETYANDSLYGTVLPAQPYPVPALQVAPVLRYQDVLEIEKTAQHIARNTARYSKAVWMSMTPEETAMLLDAYTVGVPLGGLEDASQMIPLLNCLQNTVLGTYGNSLMMPFVIPQELADLCGIDPGKLQQSLLEYQREAFVSPRSTIGLPTRGVLGEAVLGSCASAEKIDLTRFWNWQDAPADTAPGIGMVQLPTTTPPLTTGVTAPNSLTNLPPLINNLITAPQPNTSLLQAMGQAASAQQDFSPNFTGQQQLAGLMTNGQNLANAARSDALKTSQSMATAAMSQMSSLVNSSIQAGQGANPMGGGGGKTQTSAAPATGAAQSAAPAGKTGAGKTGATGGAGKTATPTAANAATPAANAAAPAAGDAGAGTAAAAGGDAGATAGAAAGAGDAAGAAGAASGIGSAISSILPAAAALLAL
jgi:hypothetical protein